MTMSASSNTGRTPFGPALIRISTLMGRRLNQLDASVLRSPLLAFLPTKCRKISFQLVKLMLLLAVASVALFLAIGMILLWASAAVLKPALHDEEPCVHEVSHPQHQHKYPELYDKHGSLR